MDLCARPGPHKAPVCPSRRTISPLFVLPQVLAGRSRTSCGATRRAVACGQGPSGRYAPTGLSFPRLRRGPLPFTRPRTATPSDGPCPSGSMASRAVSRSLRPVCRTYLGKVEFEGGDLPQRFGIRGRCGGVLVGKVLTMKVDLPHSPLGPSPFTRGTFPAHGPGQFTEPSIDRG